MESRRSQSEHLSDVQLGVKLDRKNKPCTEVLWVGGSGGVRSKYSGEWPVICIFLLGATRSNVSGLNSNLRLRHRTDLNIARRKFNLYNAVGLVNTL